MATTDDFYREQFDFECAECGGQECVDDHASGDRICTVSTSKRCVCLLVAGARSLHLGTEPRKDCQSVLQASLHKEAEMARALQLCGLVAEAHAIDEHSEWRTFADSDKPGADMNRVGGPVNHLLSDGGIGSTTIGKATKGSDAGGMFQSLTRTAQTGGADRTILQAFGMISKMCESLGLPKSIKDLSCELFKRAMDQDLVKGRSHSASCAAAIILACRQESLERSFDEVARATDKCTKKAISRAFKLMAPKVLRENERRQTAGHPSNYMVRYCSKLGMGAQHQKACQDFIEACIPKGGVQRTGSLAGHKPWDSRNPTSVAGAVLYIIANLFLVARKSDVRVAIEDIGNMVNISPNTIRSVTKDLQPDFSELLPKWVATPQQVEKMIEDGYSGSQPSEK